MREQDITLREQDITLSEQDIPLREQDITLREQDITLREQDNILREQNKNKYRMALISHCTLVYFLLKIVILLLNMKVIPEKQHAH